MKSLVQVFCLVGVAAIACRGEEASDYPEEPVVELDEKEVHKRGVLADPGYGLAPALALPAIPVHGGLSHVPVQAVEYTNAIPVLHGVPIAQPVGVPVPVGVPHPVPNHIPIEVPVYKEVKVPIERPVPYTVEKPYPVEVIKKIPVPVPKPYAVPYTILKTKHHFRHISNDWW